MKPIAKNNCDFPSLRKSGCLYVDKTAWLYRMATDPEVYFFFLARPRRFGKAIDDLAANGTSPVILIDEYDDPVAQALKNPDDAERVRDALAVDPTNLKSVSEAAFDVSDFRNFPVEGMLFQTGYLTIKDYKYGLFDLGVPDEEVRQDLSALMTNLVSNSSTARRASSRAASPRQ